jgi:hypothetical protein
MFAEVPLDNLDGRQIHGTRRHSKASEGLLERMSLRTITT